MTRRQELKKAEILESLQGWIELKDERQALAGDLDLLRALQNFLIQKGFHNSYLENEDEELTSLVLREVPENLSDWLDEFSEHQATRN